MIAGASTYALVACEIAQSMGCYEKIDFIDDIRTETPNGIKTVGTIADLGTLADAYSDAIVAIGNPAARLSVLKKIEGQTSLHIATLISPASYVSPFAKIARGCIIEPMAVIQTSCKIEMGCIISAGAVINHESVCEEGVHVDCNATVEGYCYVPSKTKICCGQVYRERR